MDQESLLVGDPVQVIFGPYSGCEGYVQDVPDLPGLSAPLIRLITELGGLRFKPPVELRLSRDCLKRIEPPKK